MIFQTTQAGSCKRFHGKNRPFRVSEQDYWKGFDFVEASRNFLWNFLPIMTAKKCETHQRLCKKTILIFRTFKNIFIS